MSAMRELKQSSKPQTRAGALKTRCQIVESCATRTNEEVPSEKIRECETKIAIKIRPLDLSSFPAESITVLERWICLACVWDVFTRHLKLPPERRVLKSSVTRLQYPELSAPTLTRPWFHRPAQNPCPYCE